MNGQNIPSEVQDCFIAAPGNVLLKADYSNIELRVLAYLSEEEVLLEAFKRGDNIHDLNTKLLFGIDKDHPDWKTIRRAAKIFVFGRSYGGTVEGIYKRVLSEVPELKFTLAQFILADRAYFSKLTKYAEWCENTIKEAGKTRVSQTAFGRKRILLGLPDEIEREALNTPIQGTAGEVCELALIELDEIFEKKPELQAHMVLTVHDSILTEVKKENAMKVAKIMKKVMEREHQIGKYKAVFPVDIGMGSSWAETDKDDNKLEL